MDRRSTRLLSAEPPGDAVSRDNFPDRLDHVTYVRIRHLGVKRKRKQAPIDFLGNGKLLRAVAVAFAVERVPVQRNEMNAGADVAGTQLFNEFRSVQAASRPGCSRIGYR